MIIDRILQKAEEKNISQADIAKHINKGTAQVTSWKKRNCNPPAELIEPIAELLGVTVQWLMTGRENDISEEEQKILQIYKNLNSDGKERIEEYAELISLKYKNV